MGMFFALKGLSSVALLLAFSFFVLLGVRKADSKGLKVFGFIVAVILWVAAANILFIKIYAMSGRECPGYKMEGDYPYKHKEKPYHEHMME